MKLICETYVSKNGQIYYNFFVEKDGKRIQVKPKWDNDLIALYVLSQNN